MVKDGLSSQFLTAFIFVLCYKVKFEWHFRRKFIRGLITKSKTVHFQEPIQPKKFSVPWPTKKTLLLQVAKRKRNKSYLRIYQNVS